MGEKTTSEIGRDMSYIGVTGAENTFYENAAGLKGKAAKDYIDSNWKTLTYLTNDEQVKLFDEVSYPKLFDNLHRITTSKAFEDKYNGPINYADVNPLLVELMMDLIFRGDNTPKSREMFIPLIENNEYDKLIAVLQDKTIFPNVPEKRTEERVDFVRGIKNGTIVADAAKLADYRRRLAELKCKISKDPCCKIYAYDPCCNTNDATKCCKWCENSNTCNNCGTQVKRTPASNKRPIKKPIKAPGAKKKKCGKCRSGDSNCNRRLQEVCGSSTSKPNTVPTKSPTTSEPSNPPTRPPAFQPTNKPIIRQSMSPATNNPTGNPTRAPALQPTKKPSQAPINGPTTKSTSKPSKRPVAIRQRTDQVTQT